uniref:Uncharacterized protein n=1 Tax=Percolomonas cosmopolitus TaxID=63605 RepID=A0A7S1KRX9_9EUKA|mmetsp:Transcript_6899/g.25740  ORF Transcript_6899/g.25740 Transcript_6899/m.25740 type:complete len:128 (+) Transcript_6899:120-503(+)
MQNYEIPIHWGDEDFVEPENTNAVQWNKIPTEKQKQILPFMIQYHQLKECKQILQEEQNRLLLRMQALYKQWGMDIERRKMQQIASTQLKKSSNGDVIPKTVLRNTIQKRAVTHQKVNGVSKKYVAK